MRIVTAAEREREDRRQSDGTLTGFAPSMSSPDTRIARPGWKRRLKERAKLGIRHLFEFGQRAGVDILPRHFYSQIPDIAALRSEASWRAPRSMFGVQGADTATQFEFVECCCPAEVVERLAHTDVHEMACTRNGEAGFGSPDAQFLYGFIRTIQPRRIVQVGCGVSTALILIAAEEAGYRPELVCIEPYPTRFLERSADQGEIELVRARAQDVPLDLLTGLGDEGFLFVDSTHTVQPGSEVNRMILEVLPRLKPGDWIHFHDIYFPYDYQRGLLDDELFFSNESVLLHAMLIHNPTLTIRAALSMLHYSDPDRLRRSLPRYAPAPNDDGLRAGAGHFAASAYLQVCSD